MDFCSFLVVLFLLACVLTLWTYDFIYEEDPFL